MQLVAKLSIHLAAAGLLTIVSAWLPAMFADVDLTGLSQPAQRWLHPQPADWPAQPSEQMQFAGRGLRFMCQRAEAVEPDGATLVRTQVVLLTGWPFVCASASSLLVYRGHSVMMPVLLPRVGTDGFLLEHFAIQLDSTRVSPLLQPSYESLGVQRCLPLRPEPAGAAANMAVYLAATLAPSACIAARRRLRRRAGCCMRCGYPTASNHRCSECGQRSGAT